MNSTCPQNDKQEVCTTFNRRVLSDVPYNSMALVQMAGVTKRNISVIGIKGSSADQDVDAMSNNPENYQASTDILKSKRWIPGEKTS